mmetsp:Transcript_11707/g.18021  ORF Transcript_11707/g.18021 Transcript_11707/m.18021 type:complete len:658 (-) Transcript_11707:87-2060(-)
MSDQREPKKDFVIKLCIVGVQGSPQIRRVRLSSITVDGNVSYPALVDVAIKYTFPDDSLEPKHYTVLLTYYDVDNDCITIASTEELVDAIEQFTNSEIKALCLRITTDVKKKSPQIPDLNAQSNSPKHGSEKSSKKSTGPIEVQNVVESFVSILINAVDHLQTQVAENYASSEAKNSVPTAPGKARTSSNSKQATRNTNGKASTERKNKAAAKPKGSSSDDKKASEGDNSEKKEKPKEEKRPFIHNRHTCDGCLCTPIIGDRHHSTNLPDYDLCSKCRQNYKGDEIQFEIVELARDRPLQQRWQRKRMNSISRPGSCRHSYRGPYDGRGRGLRASPLYCKTNSDLKEAIRRSLQDETTEQLKQLEKPTSIPGEEDAVQKGQESAENTERKPASGQDEKEMALEQNETDNSGVILTSSIPGTEPSLPSDAGKGENNSTTVNSVEKPSEANDGEIADNADDRTNAEESDSNKQEGNDSEEDSDGAKQDEVPAQVDNEKPNQDETSEPLKQLDDKEKPTSNPGEEDMAQSGLEPAENTDTSENGWQLVPDEEQDEMIARAAQLLGSALFENDLYKSDNISASNMSLPSSIPSLLSDPEETGISPAVLDKWAIHLDQLHELGFYEDVDSTEILERLTAANIGVDSEDEVSVTQVVNELLKN